jgi:hypothetical protein
MPPAPPPTIKPTSTPYRVFPPPSSPIPRPRYLKHLDSFNPANNLKHISNSNPDDSPKRTPSPCLGTTLLKQPHFTSDALGNGHIPAHPIYNYTGNILVYWHVWNPPPGLEGVASEVVERSERRRKRMGVVAGEEGARSRDQGDNGEEGGDRSEREGAREGRSEGARQRSTNREGREGRSDRKLSLTMDEGIARLCVCGERLARMGSEWPERLAAAPNGDVDGDYGLTPAFNLSLDELSPEQSGGLRADIDGMFNREAVVSTDSLKLEARRLGLLGGHEIENRERSGSRASSVSAASRSRSREG